MIKVKIIIGTIALSALVFALIKGSFGFALVLGIILALVMLPRPSNKEKEKKEELEKEELDEEIYSATSE